MPGSGIGRRSTTGVEEPLKGPILSGDRHGGGGDAGHEGVDVVRGGVGRDPAGGRQLQRSSKIAAGTDQDRLAGLGQRDEEVATQLTGAIGAPEQRITHRRPLVVGNDRVVRRCGGDDTFGHADDDRELQFDPDRGREGPDQDALTDPTVPDPSFGELQLDGAPKRRERRGGLDGVERGQSLHERDDLGGRSGLGLGPGGALGVGGQVVSHGGTQPLGQLGPTGQAGAEPVVGDEGARGGGELGGVPGRLAAPVGAGAGPSAVVEAACLGVGREPFGPLAGSGEDPGRSAHRLPFGAALARGIAAQDAQHRRAGVVVVPERQEAQELPGQRRRRQRAAPGTLEGDAGGGELVVDEPLIGDLAGEEQRHAVEGYPTIGLGQDLSQRGPDLLVGIGHRDRPDRARGPIPGRRGRRRGVRRHPQMGEGDTGGAIGVGLAGHRHHGHRGGGLGDHLPEPPLPGRHPIREVPDDGAEHHRRLRVGSQGRDRSVDQIVLSVPVGSEPVAHRVVERDHRSRTLALLGEHRQLVGVELAELAVDADDVALGRRVLGDVGEDPGIGPECAPDRRGQDGGRHRSATRPGERGGAEPLGQPVDRDHVEAGDPREGSPQEAPSGHADRVGGHHDRDRGQGIARLRPGDDVCQRTTGRRAGRTLDQLDCHGRRC